MKSRHSGKIESAAAVWLPRSSFCRPMINTGSDRLVRGATRELNGAVSADQSTALHGYRADVAFDGERELRGGALVLIEGETIVGDDPE